MRKYVPLYVDVNGLKVIVFGGGSVGYRRARLFAEGGASVIVAAKDFNGEVVKLAEENSNVKLVRLDALRDVELVKSLIESSDLIVVATSDLDANSQVASIAMSMNKLVNNATNVDEGNIIVPFNDEVNGLYIAVTSLGKAGIAARRALEKAKALLSSDVEIRTLYKAMSMIKEFMKRNIDNPKIRFRLYFEIEEDKEFRRYVELGDVEGAYKRGIEIINNVYMDGNR